jgi:hypothetical protein
MKKLITQILCSLRLAFAPRNIITAVNESAVGDKTSAIFYAVNELKIEGDWVQLAPYGKFENAVGLQVVTKDDCVQMVNEFKSLLNTPARMLGLPWYIGHPDYEPMKSRYPDTKSYGRIKDLEARDTGLFAKVKFNTAGKALIEDETFHGHSVNWALIRKRDGLHPITLKSVGFTNEPGIPNPPITAANEKTDPNMKKKIIELLKLAPAKAGEEVTDEQIETAVAGLVTTSAVNESTLAQVRGELSTVQGTVTTLNGKITALTTERDGALTEAVNEKTERQKLLISDGIRTGKILPAEKKDWELKFTTNFVTAVNELSAAKPKINTGSKFHKLGTGSPENVDRQQAIQEAVNERAQKTGCKDYRKNYLAVKKDPKHAALFAVASE